MIPSAISSRPVLVAGGAGFIGSSVTRLLCMSGYNVIVADNMIFGSLKNLADIQPSPQIVIHDFCDGDATKRLLLEIAPQFVISCIGDTFVTSAYLNPGRFLRNNVEANLNLIDACSGIGCERVVYLSSTEIYGDATVGALTENAPFDPVNTYAVTKLAADRLCYTLSLERGLNVVIARIFNCYGPNETHSYIIPEIIDQLSRSEKLVLGDVETYRDFTYVEDTARAICLLMLSSVPAGSAFNIGSNVEVKIADLARIIGSIMGVPAFELCIDPSRFRCREIRSFRSDSTRLREATGWRPLTDLETGLKKTVEWFRANGSAWPWVGAVEEERSHAISLSVQPEHLRRHG